MVAKLFLFRLFGQRPQRGRSPVEHRGTFVRPFVRPCVPPEALSGLKSALSGLESALSGLKFVLSDLRGPGGGAHGQANGQMKVPLCSTGLRPLRGRCPKSLKRNSLATIQLHGSLSRHAFCSKTFLLFQLYHILYFVVCSCFFDLQFFRSVSPYTHTFGGR